MKRNIIILLILTFSSAIIMGCLESPVDLSSSVSFNLSDSEDNPQDNYIEISSVAELQNMIKEEEENTNYRLIQDIDASGIDFKPIGYPDSPITGEHFTGKAFTRTLDGNGHTITGLTIDKPNSNFIGLFGRVGTGATVKDLSLVNPSIKGRSYVGVIAGILAEANITNVVINGSNTIAEGLHNIGGLVGLNDSSMITDCEAVGSVRGELTVGGLVGNNSNFGRINDSSVIMGIVSGANEVGGLVGRNTGFSVIVNSSSTVDEVDGINGVGGFVGRNTDFSVIGIGISIVDKVDGTDEVGGLVGSNYNSAIIMGSSARTNVVKGTNKVGGFVGNNSNGSILNSVAIRDEVNGENEVGAFVGSSNGGLIINSSAEGETGEETEGEIGEET